MSTNWKKIKVMNIHQRLLASISSGRQVDLKAVLRYELSVHLPSLFKADESMIATYKSALAKILVVDRAVGVCLQQGLEKFTLIIDGMALLQRIGKFCNRKNLWRSSRLLHDTSFQSIFYQMRSRRHFVRSIRIAIY